MRTARRKCISISSWQPETEAECCSRCSNYRIWRPTFTSACCHRHCANPARWTRMPFVYAVAALSLASSPKGYLFWCAYYARRHSAVMLNGLQRCFACGRLLVAYRYTFSAPGASYLHRRERAAAGSGAHPSSSVTRSYNPKVSTHWNWDDVHRADQYLEQLEAGRDRNGSAAEYVSAPRLA